MEFFQLKYLFSSSFDPYSQLQPFILWLSLGALLFPLLLIAQVLLSKKVDVTPVVISSIVITLLFGLGGVSFGFFDTFDGAANTAPAERMSIIARGVFTIFTAISIPILFASVQMILGVISTMITQSKRKGL